MDGLPPHVAENRRHWDATAAEWVAGGERQWASEVQWGIWGVPNAELPLLPDDLTGFRAIELGCGTGYVSAWMRRRGATVVAIDNSEEQLATARRLAAEHGFDDIEWIHGNAEATGLPAGQFDFAISEYGAAIWCDPNRWLAEAHRLLRPGGLLTFLGHHPMAMACADPIGDGPIGRTLARPYFGMHHLDWTDAVEEPGGIEFNMPISAWMRLFDELGFDVDRYDEVRAPDSATGERFWIPADWSRDYPSEQVWFLRAR